jgi:hypothetical protein
MTGISRTLKKRMPGGIGESGGKVKMMNQRVMVKNATKLKRLNALNTPNPAEKTL